MLGEEGAEIGLPRRTRGVFEKADEVEPFHLFVKLPPHVGLIRAKLGEVSLVVGV